MLYLWPVVLTLYLLPFAVAGLTWDLTQKHALCWIVGVQCLSCLLFIPLVSITTAMGWPGLYQLFSPLEGPWHNVFCAIICTDIVLTALAVTLRSRKTD
jgi:hypothetical protein